MNQAYDPLYDARLAELGEIPRNDTPPPPVKKLACIFNGKKTLGQVAMEADREQVIGDPRMVKAKYFAQGGYVPKWEDLTSAQQDQWERFALCIAKAIIGAFPNEMAQLSNTAPKPKKFLEIKG